MLEAPLGDRNLRLPLFDGPRVVGSLDAREVASVHAGAETRIAIFDVLQELVRDDEASSRRDPRPVAMRGGPTKLNSLLDDG